MYRPKKHVRLTALLHAPKVADVRSLSEEAKKAKGCTVELPWQNKMTGVRYSLTIRLELAGGDPIWTLYEGEGGKSRVVWSSPFDDVELLYDVLMLSIPEEVETDFGGARPVSAGRSAASRTNTNLPEKPEFGSAFLSGNEKIEVGKAPLGFFEGQPSAPIDPDNEWAIVPPVVPEPEVKVAQEAAQEVAKNPEPKKTEPLRQEVRQDPPRVEAPAVQEPVPAVTTSPETMSGVQPTLPVPPAYPPGYPYQAGYQYPAGYPGYPQGYYPPGYPQGYQQQYGYPPGYAPTAGVQPGAQPGYLESGVQAVQPVPPAPPDPGKPRPNVRLGQFLVEAGLVPESTIDAALQLQELVRSGSLSTAQAAEAVRRAHIRGGAVDPKLIAAPLTPADLKHLAPPLGQILVEAAIIRGPVIRQALKLQESIRSGAMTKDDAIDALCLEVFGVGRKSQDTTGETSESTNALQLLKKAQLVSDFDHETASKVRDKHGGQIVNILVKAGKLDRHTADGALKCNDLIGRRKLEEGKAIIALHYCQRSRIDLDSALKELGWES